MGKSDVVELLISKGILVDIRNDYGWIPLHVAAKKGMLVWLNF
ncbi:ankyrin repeat domain-containing protein [Wolbachia endosymbiont of Chironomus riparius]